MDATRLHPSCRRTELWIEALAELPSLARASRWSARFYVMLQNSRALSISSAHCGDPGRPVAGLIVAVACLFLAWAAPARAQEALPAQFETAVGTLIETGAGYDAVTGSARRVVVDLQQEAVPGLKPLSVQRHFGRRGRFGVYGFTFAPFWSMSYYYDYKIDETIYDFWSASGRRLIAIPVGTEVCPLSLSVNERFEAWMNSDGSKTVVLISEDGERIAFQSIGAFNGGSQDFRIIYFEDAHGRRTIATHTNGDALVDRLTDPTGRWISFQYANGPSTGGGLVAEAISSDGQWVRYNYSAGTVQYSDGTSASFQQTVNSNSSTSWTFHDVRPAGPMPSARYNLVPQYRSSGAYDWVVKSVVEPGSGTMVSMRSVSFYKDPELPFTVTETRGDGATRILNVGDYGEFTQVGNFRGNITRISAGAGKLNSMTDARGNTTSYQREGVFGNLTRLTHPDMSYRAWTYTDPNMPFFVATARDELGRVTTYDRFPNGIIGQINFPDGSTEGWNGLNAFLQPTIHRNRGGFNEGLVYSTSGQLTRRWLPNVTWTDHIDYTYYPDGHVWEDRLWTKTDPRGNVTTYEYDRKFVGGVQGTEACSGRGLVTKIINHDGTYQSFGYDIYGNKIWEENELRQRTTYTYDVYRRLKTSTSPLGHTTSYEYQHEGFSSNPLAHTENKPRFVTQPSQKRVARTYDADFRTLTEVVGYGTGEAATTTNSYDAVGNLQSVTDPVGRVTTFAFDTRNRETHQYAPLGRTTQWQYDAAGNVTRVINPDGTFTRREYDAMNRVIHVWDERNQHTGTTYHASGQVNVITDPRGNTYTHGYDAAARLTSRTYPDGSAERWSYDAVGNKTSETTRTGQVLRLYYDTRNREYWREWDNSAAPFVGTQYDAASRVTNKYNWHGWLTYTFDAVGRAISETQKIYGPTSTEDGKTETVTFGYDSDGNRTSFGSGAIGLGYLYNSRQQLSTIRYNNSDWVTYQYNAAGQRRFRFNINGTASDINYDDAGRLNYLMNYRRADGSWVFLQKFGYDLRDRRTWQVRDDAYGDVWEYYEDSQLKKQRTHVWRPDQNINGAAAFTDTFNYDAAGNRTSWDENGAVTTYTADSTNRYTAITGLPIQHDGRGNVTQLGGWSFGQNPENRMTRATGPGHDYRFHYDAMGRLSKIVDWAVPGGAFEYRFYDGSQQFWRVKGDGTWLDLTIWGPTSDEVISRYVPGSDWWSNWQFYHQDPLNSVVAVTSHTGAVLERYKYDAFGEAAIYDASWNPRSTSAIGNRWRFTGQEYFVEIGIHNYKARWYCDRIGRFLQNDPIRFDAGDMNLYRYCRNNPIYANDPTGLEEDDSEETAEQDHAKQVAANNASAATAPPPGRRPGDWSVLDPEKSKQVLANLKGSTLVADGKGGIRAEVKLGSANLSPVEVAFYTKAKTAHEVQGHGADALASNPDIAKGLQDGQIIAINPKVPDWMVALGSTEVRSATIELGEYQAAKQANIFSGKEERTLDANIAAMKAYIQTNSKLIPKSP